MSVYTNFPELIPERKKLLGTTLVDLLDTITNFENKTLILVDIETLGLNPTFEYEQVTELAACAINGTDMNVLGNINFKVKLSKSALELLTETESIQRYSWERRQKRRGKSAILDPNQIIEMTRYNEINAPIESERNTIEKFYEFIKQYNNPVIVAHNAEFDIKYLMTRGKLYQLEFPMVGVLDTLKISQFFFVPALETLKKNPDVDIIVQKLIRLKKNKSYHISSRLGDLATAFGIDAQNWHTANSDVEMMRLVLNEILEFLETHRTVDISINQEIAIRKTLRKGVRLKPKKR